MSTGNMLQARRDQIQGIQFASVGGLTYHLIEEKGLGREFPADWRLRILETKNYVNRPANV